ncbi:FecR family protein [Flavivirga jejuensis]|uniref:DUF4974 domain-containing protein n=1 Tax=Flavivirga jejuensis TaxID=870487 RepID=A0ABT8WQT4_9FLAO|nr:FecR family protein [Flavivirga jejuensis]MDO5975510.1 DUF4974 domain-containing protein [Flavivirga jejuensis]
MKNLILKYLTNSISEIELTKLREWLRSLKNQEKFRAYIQDDFNLNNLYNTIDVDTAFNKVWNSTEKKRNKVLPLFKRRFIGYGVAASVVFLLSLVYFFNGEKIPQYNTPVTLNNNIEIGTDKAILTLEDGTNVPLEKGESYIANNVSSNGEGIVYSTTNAAKKEIAFNYLTIPRGGQYHVILSDGTQVWLNSDSQIKYPVSFVEGKTRSIELIYGEAYFDVSSSSQHKGADFKVLNSNQEVRVIGTEFNIKAYKDENTIKTTLVEGKVEINCKGINKILTPNQQSSVNLENNKITVSLIDVYKEISWKDGVFSFENMPLKDIMKVLSRWYDIEVVFKNKNLENVTFNGGLKKKQSIVDILSIIKNMNNIDYEINNKTVVLR